MQVISDCDGQCYICDSVDISNDVHHVWYGEPSYTGCRQFVVLCRFCHDQIHLRLEPAGSSCEKDRIQCWSSFDAIARQIRSGLKGEQSSRIKARGCKRCGNRKNVFRVDPITLEVDSETKNGVIVCSDCFQSFSVKFTALTHGTKVHWKERLAYLRNENKELNYSI